MYKHVIKRLLDIILSSAAIVVLALPMLIIAIAIKIDDPGPVLFRQKRVGMKKNGEITYFMIWKFRSMKMSAPHDTPTHLLENPEQYITRVGRVIRKMSLDELPQIYQVFTSQLSVIGPRPALWSQTDLITEREKYKANDIKPGITGWAQINGRDELEIPVKAKLDGDYAAALNAGKFKGFAMDVKCFFQTIVSVLKSDGVVEGGLGEKREYEKEATEKRRTENVLFLANHFITLYAFRKELIQKLREEGHEVYLSIPKDENNYFSNLGCHIILTEINRHGINPIKDFKLIVFYKKMIRKINPDIIFSYTIKPNIYGSLVTSTVPFGKKYVQICNITGTGATFLKDDAIAKICKLLYKISVRNCYKVFFQNTTDKNFFVENGLVKDNYEMLPGSGCNLQEHAFEPMPENETIRFIFIGRVMKLKGIDEYLQAAKCIKEKYSNTEFIIAGWNEEESYKKILAEYQKKGYVNYIGFRNDIKDWIEKCHCTILPSHGGEGVPNVLLESAAAGRVCIGAKSSGITDVIEDGVTGYLFETGCADDLIAQIERFLKLSAEQQAAMGLAGRKRIEREFDRRIVINRYMREVEKL